MTGVDLAAASLVMAVGAVVQGSVGFGISLVAAPLLVLIDPDLVPGPIILATVVLNLLMLRPDRAHADLRGLRWALAGLVPGTVAGAAALALLPAGRLDVLFALVVLAAVGVSLAGLHVEPRTPTLLGAGVVSGFMGTVVSIGGPPIAMLYQRARGPMLRATLARYFTVSSLLSLGALAVVGRLGRDEGAAALALLPGVLVGFAVSRRVAGHLDRGHTRTAVLTVSAVTSLVVLVRAAL